MPLPGLVGGDAELDPHIVVGDSQRGVAHRVGAPRRGSHQADGLHTFPGRPVVYDIQNESGRAALLSGRYHDVDGVSGRVILPADGSAGLPADDGVYHRPGVHRDGVVREGGRNRNRPGPGVLCYESLRSGKVRVKINGQRHPLRSFVGVGQGYGAAGRGGDRQAGGRNDLDRDHLRSRLIQLVGGSRQVQNGRPGGLPGWDDHRKTGHRLVIRPRLGRVPLHHIRCRRIIAVPHREPNRRILKVGPSGKGNFYFHPDVVGAFRDRGRVEGPGQPGGRASTVHDPDPGVDDQQRASVADHRQMFHRLGHAVVGGRQLQNRRPASFPGRNGNRQIGDAAFRRRRVIRVPRRVARRAQRYGHRGVPLRQVAARDPVVGPGGGDGHFGEPVPFAHRRRGNAQHHSAGAGPRLPRPGGEPDQFHPGTEQGGHRAGDPVVAETEPGQRPARRRRQTGQGGGESPGEPVAGNQQCLQLVQRTQRAGQGTGKPVAGQVQVGEVLHPFQTGDEGGGHTGPVQIQVGYIN